MSTNTTTRKVRLIIAAAVTAASLGTGATVLVSMSGTSAHAVNHSVSSGSWPAPTNAPANG